MKNKALITEFLAENMDESEDFVWLTKEDTLKYIKDGVIEDGRVLTILLKYLVSIMK